MGTDTTPDLAASTERDRLIEVIEELRQQRDGLFAALRVRLGLPEMADQAHILAAVEQRNEARRALGFARSDLAEARAELAGRDGDTTHA